MLDPILTAQGRRARGSVNINANVTGTTAAPLANGTAQLSNGDLTDYTQGAHINDVTATIQAENGRHHPALAIQRQGRPRHARRHRLDQPDRRHARRSAFHRQQRPRFVQRPDERDDRRQPHGPRPAQRRSASRRLRACPASGHSHSRTSCAAPLARPVSRCCRCANANAPPPPPAPPETQSTIALNLTLDAPQQVFIRGRGLDAELGGTIHIGGTAAKPIPDGGLHLRQGTLSVIGTTLELHRGMRSISAAPASPIRRSISLATSETTRPRSSPP